MFEKRKQFSHYRQLVCSELLVIFVSCAYDGRVRQHSTFSIYKTYIIIKYHPDYISTEHFSVITLGEVIGTEFAFIHNEYSKNQILYTHFMISIYFTKKQQASIFYKFLLHMQCFFISLQ